MSNPDNQRKVANTIRFLTDHGPKLLLAYILFGNRLGRFITGLAARLIFGAARLAAAGFKLIAALPWWAKVGLAGTALFGAGAVVPKVFPGTTKDVADDAADALKAERGAEAAAEEITRQNTERNFLQMFGDFITGAGAERTEQADRLTTGTEASDTDFLENCKKDLIRLPCSLVVEWLDSLNWVAVLAALVY